MPTDILRRQRPAAGKVATRSGDASKGQRLIEIKLARGVIRAALADGETADRIWAALPLYGTAERWGDAVHFEVPVASGRDRSARLNAKPGEIYYWPQERRILIPFGATPISRPGEMRLPAPANVIAVMIDDAGALRECAAGEKVIMTRLVA